MGLWPKTKQSRIHDTGIKLKLLRENIQNQRNLLFSIMHYPEYPLEELVKHTDLIYSYILEKLEELEQEL